MTGRRRQQIRAAAEKILRRANVTGPPIPVEYIAHVVGAELRYAPYGGDMSGLVFREGGRAIIGVNALHAKTRQRFTIAHEIGHLQLHADQEFHLDRDYRAYRRDLPETETPNALEVDANYFAAELLMPPDYLRHDLIGHRVDVEDDEELARLADRYKVSLQAMIIRLTSLSLIRQA